MVRVAVPKAEEPISEGSTISPTDSARYTRDMLKDLRLMAEKQGQYVLAHLLMLAAMEAEAIVAGH